jgi:hypothetical protein
VLPTDAHIALAFVAKRQGQSVLPVAEWSHVLSLVLGWMPPGAAREFVKSAELAGLLSPVGESLELTFDAAIIKIPNRYKPPANMVVEAADAPMVATPAKSTDDSPIFPRLLQRLAEAKRIAKEAALLQVAEVQAKFGGRLTADAALVQVAMNHGLEVASDASAELAAIKSAAKP